MTSQATLESIEKLLVAELANPHNALQAAYRLGVIDGQLQMATVGLKALQPAEEETKYCACANPLTTEAEKRNGVCRECL